MARTKTPEVCLDANAFMMEHGRHPRIGDPVPPWRYRGWLFLITQLADFNPQATGRWPYYLRTFEAGRLLDEPIPQVEFLSSHEPRARDGLKMIEKAVDIVFEETGSHAALPALVDWLAYGMAVSKDPSPLSDKIQEKLYRHWNLEPLLTVPSDYFGTLICEYRGGGWRNKTGFYPTPHNVCEMMARMLFHDGHRVVDGRDSRTLTVCDPAVGTGRMLLHASNHSFCLYGQDIDPLVCKVTMLNGVMYAPWLAFPFPAHILDTGLNLSVGLGNSLSMDAPEILSPQLTLTHRQIPPPPAPLPGVPQIEGCPMYRIDDRNQGLLFDDLFAIHIGDETDVHHSL